MEKYIKMKYGSIIEHETDKDRLIGEGLDYVWRDCFACGNIIQGTNQCSCHDESGNKMNELSIEEIEND